MEETVYKAPRAQEGRTGLVLEGGGMGCATIVEM